MKFKYVITGIALSLALCAFAQSQGIRYDVPTAYMQNKRSGNLNIPSDVIGSPYVDENYKLGTVLIKEDESYSAYMRYNAFHDEMEMQEGDKAVSLMKRDYVKARLDGKLYIITPFKVDGNRDQGYVVVLKDGPTALYLKQNIILKEGKEATSSYSKAQPPKFERQDFYLLGFGEDTPASIKLNKKSVLNAFSSNRKDVEKFVKDNKLKLKTEEEVLKLLNFYDTL